MTKKTSRTAKAILAAGAFAMLAVSITTPAEAGRRTRYLIGGIAAGIAGAALVSALSSPRPRYETHYYYGGGRYYAPPRYRVRRVCRTYRGVMRKLRWNGYYDLHRIRTRPGVYKLRAVRNGRLYGLRVTRCRGNIVSRWRI